MRANFSFEGIDRDLTIWLCNRAMSTELSAWQGCMEHARNYVMANRNAEVPKNGSSGFPRAEELPAVGENIPRRARNPAGTPSLEG